MHHPRSIVKCCRSIVAPLQHQRIMATMTPHRGEAPSAQPVRDAQFITLNPKQMGNANTYKVIIGAVVPRPIAWVSTRSKDGRTNLAPFSFFTAVAVNPPTLMFAPIQNADGSKKDTLKNIEETQEFVINTACESNVSFVNETSAVYPYGVSEFEECGLTQAKCTEINVPRVLESPISFECKLLKTTQIGDGSAGSGTAVFGQIVAIHVREDCYLGDYKIDLEKLQPISRLAGAAYGRTSGVFDLVRPGKREPSVQLKL